MIEPKNLRLIRHIVCEASKRESKLKTISILKYLYLADLLMARATGGKTITGWPWKFHHFGPYCLEAVNAISDAVKQGFVRVDKLPSRFSEEDFSLFSEPEDLGADESRVDGDVLGLDARLRLRRLIEEFTSDTYRLLHFVYRDTEPMQNASPGDLLDFSLARVERIEEPIVLKMMKKAEIEKAKGLVASLRASRPASVSHVVPFDKVFEESVAMMDSADAEPLSAKGVASIISLLPKK